MSYIINDIDYDNLIDDNDEIIYNDIIRLNPTYESDIIQNNKYYIGLCSIIDNNFIVTNILPSNIFYIYNYDQLLDYLLSYSIIKNNWQTIEIIKINININNYFISYNCVIKTYFIRLIQRQWKYYLHRRNRYLLSYKMINDLLDREIGKKHNLFKY